MILILFWLLLFLHNSFTPPHQTLFNQQQHLEIPPIQFSNDLSMHWQLLIGYALPPPYKTTNTSSIMDDYNVGIRVCTRLKFQVGQDLDFVTFFVPFLHTDRPIYRNIPVNEFLISLFFHKLTSLFNSLIEHFDVPKNKKSEICDTTVGADHWCVPNIVARILIQCFWKSKMFHNFFTNETFCYNSACAIAVYYICVMNSHIELITCT